ncbi:hypothetical protein EDD85DRAFT_788804 [Armillaria nabsnona]|nr:hypothetical protein EDD85DRAFT_788804 [Armillaria nabsnona]
MTMETEPDIPQNEAKDPQRTASHDLNDVTPNVAGPLFAIDTAGLNFEATIWAIHSSASQSESVKFRPHNVSLLDEVHNVCASAAKQRVSRNMRCSSARFASSAPGSKDIHPANTPNLGNRFRHTPACQYRQGAAMPATVTIFVHLISIKFMSPRCKVSSRNRKYGDRSPTDQSTGNQLFSLDSALPVPTKALGYTCVYSSRRQKYAARFTLLSVIRTQEVASIPRCAYQATATIRCVRSWSGLLVNFGTSTHASEDHRTFFTCHSMPSRR